MKSIRETDEQLNEMLVKQEDHEARLKILEEKQIRHMNRILMELIIALLIAAAAYTVGKLT